MPYCEKEGFTRKHEAGGVTTVRPAFFMWPFMDLTEELTLPRLLRFEILHTLLLGIPLILWVCASEMLKGPLLSTTELLNSKKFGEISSRLESTY